jgi:hypothetical protein
MQNQTEPIPTLDNINFNNANLLFEFEELVLKHFKELSEDMGDALFITDVTINRFIKFAQIQTKPFETLSEEIDSIFSKHKFKIIKEVNQLVTSFVTNDNLVAEEKK